MADPDLQNLPDLDLVPVFMIHSGKPCTIRRYGEYDALGRCDFFLDWKEGDRNRGQTFFARPEELVSVVQLGSLWRHVSGNIYRVSKIVSANENVLTAHELTRERVTELKADGIEPDEFSMVVEPAWFKHAALEVNS